MSDVNFYAGSFVRSARSISISILVKVGFLFQLSVEYAYFEFVSSMY